MKPGDMIEWVYIHNNSVVPRDEELWSSSMQRWVPIGGTALLISITEETKCVCTYTWLSEKGLFHAREDNSEVLKGIGTQARRLFHAREDNSGTQ